MISRRDTVRSTATYWLAYCLVVSAIAWVSFIIVGLREDLQKSNEARNALIEQVTNMGGTPVVGPAGKEGPRGQAGTPGRDGRDGSKGSDGKAGSDGANGTDGAAGSDGKDGADGADGAPGRDGRDGVDGKDGAPGPKGDKGDPGPTCPDGYTPQEVELNTRQEGLFNQPVTAVVCVAPQTMEG